MSIYQKMHNYINENHTVSQMNIARLQGTKLGDSHPACKQEFNYCRIPQGISALVGGACGRTLGVDRFQQSFHDLQWNCFRQFYRFPKMNLQTIERVLNDVVFVFQKNKIPKQMHLHLLVWMERNGWKTGADQYDTLCVFFHPVVFAHGKNQDTHQSVRLNFSFVNTLPIISENECVKHNMRIKNQRTIRLAHWFLEKVMRYFRFYRKKALLILIQNYI